MEVRRERLRIVGLPSTGRPCPLVHVTLPLRVAPRHYPTICGVGQRGASVHAFRRSGSTKTGLPLTSPVLNARTPERLNARTPERLFQVRRIVVEGERVPQGAEDQAR